MEDHERRDLAAMLQPVVRALVEAENARSKKEPEKK